MKNWFCRICKRYGTVAAESLTQTAHAQAIIDETSRTPDGFLPGPSPFVFNPVECVGDFRFADVIGRSLRVKSDPGPSFEFDDSPIVLK